MLLSAHHRHHNITFIVTQFLYPLEVHDDVDDVVQNKGEGEDYEGDGIHATVQAAVVRGGAVKPLHLQKEKVGSFQGKTKKKICQS